MANKEHLKILKQGEAAWNQWRNENPVIKPDGINPCFINLMGADLSGIDLRKANLSQANLGGANLNEADLSGANLSNAVLSSTFVYANLSGANLSGAKLNMASLIEANLSSAMFSASELIFADLSGTNLSNAYLDNANFRDANLTYANLSGADLYETIFANTNLKYAKGLDKCQHLGPSIIDHRTLQKSGPLPLEFLRGCGLPDKLIKSLKDLLSKPQYDSCFISYSSKDNDFVNKLFEDLRSKEVPCWHAPHDMKGGKKTREQIAKAIKSHKRLLIVLSEHSMRSRWVKTEITEAYEREVKENRRVLFPIRLVEMEKIEKWECFDTDLGTDLAKKVREYHIPEFQNWENLSSYKQSFDNLLEDLKIPAKKPKPTN